MKPSLKWGLFQGAAWLLLIGSAAGAWAGPEDAAAPASDGSSSSAPAEAQKEKAASQSAESQKEGAASQPAGGSTSDSAAGASAVAPESSSPAAAESSKPAPTESSAVASATTSGPGLISVDFKDADIRQVLRIISLKSGVDIVAGADVEGLVTIKLTNVPWEQALEIILRTYGFTYERKDAIVRVMTVAALEKEALSTEVFSLDYAKAKEVPDVLKEMLSERGRVKYDERTNTVIVTDIPSNLFQIKQVIGRLDQRTPQVLIETKVVETRLTKNEQLGIDWSPSMTLAASTVSVPTTFPFPGGSDFGGSIGRAFIPRAGTFAAGTPASITRGRIPETGGTFTFGTLSSTGLSAIMHFLQSRTDTKIVSNPSIAALNNQKASVHIGSEYPIPNYTIDPTTGRTSLSGYTAKNIGTVLTVTPHINPSSEIVVDLKPEIISAPTLITYDVGGGFSVSLPQFTIQTAETQVRIQNGDTIAIGGLVKETDTKTVAKVPVLGDIPLVGALFKNTTKYGTDPVRQDLLIFLTVKTIDKPPVKSADVAAAAGGAK